MGGHEPIIVFATSDKGGTGRSVTSCNLAYRLSIKGHNVAYLDFDFGSPTAGALFEIEQLERGTDSGNGLHSFLTGRTSRLASHDIRAATNRKDLQSPRHPYQLALVPGDRGGGEFGVSAAVVQRCIELLVKCRQEYDITFVDLSAGRSAALEIVLSAMAASQLRNAVARWLVFHRWTRQHILAANGLVHGDHGLKQNSESIGYGSDRLLDSLRYVRTAVPSTGVAGHEAGGSGPQWAWLRKQDKMLDNLAQINKIGTSVTLGETPMEPVLQWREQVILDADVDAKIANAQTREAFVALADDLIDEETWKLAGDF